MSEKRAATLQRRARRKSKKAGCWAVRRKQRFEDALKSSEPCRILFHPTLLARRTAELAESQGATRLEQDACGRPFVQAADPLGPSGSWEAPAAAPEPARIHSAWLIRLIRALGREAGPPVGEVRRR